MGCQFFAAQSKEDANLGNLMILDDFCADRTPRLCIVTSVVPPTSPSVADVVRSTLESLESTEELASDDPALTELKESIVSNITELEVGKIPKAPVPEKSLPQRILWIRPRGGKDTAKASPLPDTPRAGADDPPVLEVTDSSSRNGSS
ncbi:MAG TPA: hypothetical protein VGG26_08080 [Terracidiphilus sp.]|jgi:hypothetical protein